MPDRVNPIPANSFILDIGIEKIGSIMEVSGLENETEVRELTQSSKGGKVIVVKSQGASPLKTGKITLKYAAFKGDPVRKWREDVVAGKMEGTRRDITITIFDEENSEAMAFNFANSWPSKYSFSSFSSKSNEAVNVTVIIEHEGMRVAGYNS